MHEAGLSKDVEICIDDKAMCGALKLDLEEACWEEYFDEEQNRAYFYNSVTGTTQWERPPEHLVKRGEPIHVSDSSEAAPTATPQTTIIQLECVPIAGPAAVCSNLKAPQLQAQVHKPHAKGPGDGKPASAATGPAHSPVSGQETTGVPEPEAEDHVPQTGGGVLAAQLLSKVRERKQKDRAHDFNEAAEKTLAGAAHGHDRPADSCHLHQQHVADHAPARQGHVDSSGSGSSPKTKGSTPKHPGSASESRDSLVTSITNAPPPGSLLTSGKQPNGTSMPSTHSSPPPAPPLPPGPLLPFKSSVTSACDASGSTVGQKSGPPPSVASATFATAPGGGKLKHTEPQALHEAKPAAPRDLLLQQIREVRCLCCVADP